MPVFEYHCSNCGTEYDVFHKGREIVEDVWCPACGSAEYTRLMSAHNVASSGKAAPDVSIPRCERGEDCCGGACTTE